MQYRCHFSFGQKGIKKEVNTELIQVWAVLQPAFFDEVSVKHQTV